MKHVLALAAIALLALVPGCSGSDPDLEARVAALEKQVAELGARPAVPTRPPVAKLDLDGSPSVGPEDAPVVIVEFSDFQCPYCKRANPTVARILEEYPDQVRRVFKHFPLSFHRQAMNAHRAALAAGEQGRFWEMHAMIFDSGKGLAPETMKEHAAALGLDVERFEADFGSERFEERIQADMAEGRQAGVRGTPAFFINGRLISGAQPYEVFKRRVEEVLESETS